MDGSDAVSSCTTNVIPRTWAPRKYRHCCAISPSIPGWQLRPRMSPCMPSCCCTAMSCLNPGQRLSPSRTRNDHAGGLPLRVKGLDFASPQIVVRDGQGAHDRLTLLPQTLVVPLHEEDVVEGYGDVYLPYALVQVIIKRCLQSCGPSRCVSHDLRDRLRGPVDRVCALVPCGNKLFERGLAHHWRRKVCDAATLPWQTENHGSTGFIHEQWTGVKWQTKRGWLYSHGRTA